MNEALTIMRMQPLHNGHKKIIDTMLEENDRAFLLIGSPDAQNERNPYSLNERKAFVESLYEKEISEGKLTVLPIEDINNPPKWVAHALSKLDGANPTNYYCGNGQDGYLFKEKGFAIRSFDRDELPISATSIREKMSKGDASWKDDVPTKVANLIENKRSKNMIDNNDDNSPLFCDLYHLTMGQAWFNDKRHDRVDTHEMIIRKTPFNGTYAVATGLGEVLQWMDKWHFTTEDIDYLRSLKSPRFSEDFLKMIEKSKLEVTVEAVPEGELVFPNQPIVRVTGPAWQVAIVETAILNVINDQSFTATKQSRITLAAGSDGKNRPVIDMTLRRAKGQGGFSTARAAHAGGSTSTSNVRAGEHYDIPVAGTMAHSFIMQYDNELDAFKSFLRAFPEDASLLIDTYDTIEGAKNAVRASKETGIPLKGVRLDSGDLAYLSKETRKILDKGGCTKTNIVASNDLDEYSIRELILQKAPIDVFGVGTKLAAPSDQATIGGVYKLKRTNGRDVIKLSEDEIKTTIPGATDIVRILDKNGKYNGDIIIKEGDELVKDGKLTRDVVSINMETNIPKTFKKGTDAYMPMVPVVINGKVNPLVRDRKVSDIRLQTFRSLSKLDKSHLRFKDTHTYVAGLEEGLFNQRQNMRAERYGTRNKNLNQTRNYERTAI